MWDASLWDGPGSQSQVDALTGKGFRSSSAVLKGHTGTVRCLLLAGKGEEEGLTAISGSKDGTLRVWSLKSGECEKVLKGHEGGVRCSALSDSGDAFVSGGYDGEARIWEINSGQCLRVLKGHTGTIFSVLFSRGKVITGGVDVAIRVWDSQSGYVLFIIYWHLPSHLISGLTPKLTPSSIANARRY